MINFPIRRIVHSKLKKEALICVSPGSIFDHLSFEATLTERCIISSGWSILLIYISQPNCVVVGKHQNPWLECSTRLIKANKLDLARRISGGGTVFHDSGNVNFSVISERSNYDRRKNLEMLVSALHSCGVQQNLEINEMFDVLMNGQKISGTAARLDKTSLHHFTCLVNADLKAIESYLEPTFSCDDVISSRATPSRLAKVANAARTTNHAAVQAVFSKEILIESFLTKYFEPSVMNEEDAEANNLTLSDLDSEICSVFDVFNNDRMLISEYHRRLRDYRSWEWIYGKTPPFSVKYTLSLHDRPLTIEFDFENGCITKVGILSPKGDLLKCEDSLKEFLLELPLRTPDLLAAAEQAKTANFGEIESIILGKTFAFLLSVSTNDLEI